MRAERVPPHGCLSGELKRGSLERELLDISVVREVFGREGFKGLAFCCEVCDQHHYLDWEMIVGNLQEVLDEGHLRAHEPAYDPDPHDYVSWSYARGLIDGFESCRATETGDVLVQVIVNDAADGGAD